MAATVIPESAALSSEYRALQARPCPLPKVHGQPWHWSSLQNPIAPPGVTFLLMAACVFQSVLQQKPHTPVPRFDAMDFQRMAQAHSRPAREFARRYPRPCYPRHGTTCTAPCTRTGRCALGAFAGCVGCWNGCYRTIKQQARIAKRKPTEQSL